jgi:hypothetical protein
MGAESRDATIEKYSMEYFGYIVPVYGGLISQRDFHHIKPAVGDFNNGFAQVSSEKYWKP